MPNCLSELSKVTRLQLTPVNTLKTLVNAEPAKILVVDDHEFSRLTARDLLALDGYEVLEADGIADLFERILKNQPDLILLDVMMPQSNGFEICQRLKQDERTSSIPIVFMTVADEQRWRKKSHEVGGDGFLAKPLDRFELLSKVKFLIQQKRLNEELNQTNQVLFSLASVIEQRYSEGGSSSPRLEALAKSFGEYLQLSSEAINDLIFAARLHDIGTVAIPEHIFLKKGELTPEERELIKNHVLIGEQICKPIQKLKGVLPIIRHHHERWDGSGYPDSLTGEEIPELAQVFQILDIYDALTSPRPHKNPLTPREALEIIVDETGKGWRNPQLVEKFTGFILNPTSRT